METENSFRLQVYVDPLFGSERFVTFEADWVREVSEGTKWLIFRPRTPVTNIVFTNGDRHTVHGRWAQRIRDAQKTTAQQSDSQQSDSQQSDSQQSDSAQPSTS